MKSNPAITNGYIPEYDYGDQFNYGQWTEGTTLTMVNVPWNSDYRDVVRFANTGALNTWINAQPNKTINKMSLLKWGQNVRINVPLNTAMQYNYARASNPTMPVANDTQKDYYYFVQDYRYVNPNTTELVLQVDVWQTFGYQVSFGMCYVERGHIGIANQNAFNDYGRLYLTIPEGLDVGSEMQTVHVETTQLMSTTAPTNDPLAFDVLVCSTADLSKSGGTADAPVLNAATGGTFQGLPTGASFYLFRTSAMFSAWLAVNSSSPWITDSIMSVTLIPSMSRYVPNYNYGTNLGDSNIQFYLAGGDVPKPKKVALMNSWRDSSFVSDVLGPFKNLSKFLTYPYMIMELTTFTGSPIIIKPEGWQDPNATVREIAAFMPPGQRIAITPLRYNTSDLIDDPDSIDDGGEFMDMAVTLDNFPTMPVINNMAINYLASNRNGINFQFQAADWSQQKAMRGAEATGDIAGANITNAAMQSSIANKAQMNSANMGAETGMNNMLLGLGAGSIGALAGTASGAGGLPGMGLLAAPGMAGNNATNTQNQALVAINARGDSAVAGIKATASIRDTNVGLAQFAARGDYQTAIAGINAKLQDVRMTQPSVSGQFGGDAFNIINNFFGYSLRWKMLSPNAIKQIGTYWLRYGYAVQQWIDVPDDFMVMEKFTYWKLSETYISQARIPELFKQTIRGIFEKGVTVWSAPGYIGNTSLFDNKPKAGASY
jgi:hypothetical protein